MSYTRHLAAYLPEDATFTAVRFTAPAAERNQRGGDTGNRQAPKLLQLVGGDFDVSAKFNQIPGQNWEGWGFYADGGAGTAWLRADVLRNGTSGLLHWFAGTTDAEDGALTAFANVTFPALYFGTAVYLRLKKAGTTYTFYTSPNGVTWDQRTMFTWTGRLARLGPMLAKAATAAPSIVDVDWFRNTPASGPVAEVFGEAALIGVEAHQVAQVDTVRTLSVFALDAPLDLITNGVTADVGVVAAGSAEVVVTGMAEIGITAWDGIADPSDLANVWLIAPADTAAHDASPEVVMSAQVA